jgi:hypothetical protein
MFPKCPKCNAALVPGDTGSQEGCPACGLVFAKYLQAQSGTPERVTRAGGAAPPSRGPADADGSPLLERLLYVPPRVGHVAFYGRCAAFSFFFVWGWRLYAMDVSAGEMGGSFMHLIILVFHEAGHVLFIPLGRFMTVLGGSLMQVLLPLVLMGAFLYGLGGTRRDSFAASLMLWWAGVAVLDVAPYIWDAYDPKLMLLGGQTGAESDGHDWQNILGDLGLIGRAHLLGSIAHNLGLVLMLAAWAWGAVLLYLQFRNRGSDVIEEED